jgi:hypothetical protein
MRRSVLLLSLLATVLAVAAVVFALPAASDDDPDVCFTYQGTTTCQPAAAVAEHGIFVATVTCDPAGAVVHGTLPPDATTVSAVGADVPATATAGPDGAVTLTIPGAETHGLALDNGHTAPLELAPDCDRPGVDP